MNGHERISAALEGKATDTTPIMLHNFMMAAKESGVSMEQYRNDPQIISRSFMASVEKYKFDGILVDIDTVTLAGAVGVPVDFPVEEPARTHQGNLLSLEDVRSLKPANIEGYKYIQIWLEAVRLLKEYFKDEIYIRGNCDQAPFSLASMMRGPQNWMMDLMITEENLINELLDYCTDATSQFITLMAQTGCDMVSNGDSPAGPEMISPDMYEQYALPFEKKIVDIAHQAGLHYALHVCGNTDVILDKMLKTGADAFELDYKTDVQKAFDIYHDKATLIGNIDPSGVLALGTADMVRQKTRELLETYKTSNRFILNAGCAIPPNTPDRNLTAMLDVARDF
ncbi:MAG: uroporphyrinogen decarboxylase family protein [Bacteroidales bacterium]|nr:uroporphyrinogen decarboxylase family protein [Bacteroidales bacterium]